jgi:leader peptidase (prepilin peptidase)/N-methyltransferase
MGVAALLVGLFGGALVPLPAYRLGVPFEEPDRDSCVHCGRPLGAWVRFLSRCTGCGRRLGPPAWLTAGAAAVVAGGLAFALGPTPVLPLFVGLAVVGVLLGAIDIACARLPHVLVLPAIAVSAAGFLVVAIATGQWPALLRSLGGGAALAAGYGLLYLLPGRAVGRGDVTLAALLGLYLGWLGWRYVLFGGLLPWLVNVPVLLALVLAGRVRRGSSVPFGPAMLVGAWLTVVLGRALS